MGGAVEGGAVAQQADISQLAMLSLLQQQAQPSLALQHYLPTSTQYTPAQPPQQQQLGYYSPPGTIISCAMRIVQLNTWVCVSHCIKSTVPSSFFCVPNDF